MKLKLTIFSAVTLMAFSANAQIQINKSGHVIVGEAKKAGGASSATDPTTILQLDTTATMTIDGKNVNHTGAKISFGGQGHGYIGEDLTKTLNLYSNYGLTYNCMDYGRVFTFLPTLNFGGSGTSERVFSFSCPVRASQYYTSSDMRLKTDISLLEGTGTGLSSLTPVSYRLRTLIKKEGDVEAIKATSDNYRTSTHLQYGFLAQEVKEVYPELVCEDEEGNLAIDYQGFIPLLVDAIVDLRKTVARQEETIASQEETIGRLVKATGLSERLGKDSAAGQKAYLSQNSANPARGESAIEFFIPSGAVSASIEIASADGLYSHRYDIGERGKGSLKVDASSLSPGIYVYTLIVDSEEIGSKRLIVAY